jgi:hypothetical protein
VSKAKDLRAALETELGFDPVTDSAHHRQERRRRVDGEPGIDVRDELHVTG